jgi:hypothetical protein
MVANTTWTLAMILMASSALAGEPPASQEPNACAGAKIRAATRAAACRVKLAGKEAASGQPVDQAKIDKCHGRLDATFARFEARGECVTVGDTEAAISLVEALVSDLEEQLALGTPNACQGEKLRLASRKVYCKGSLEARQAQHGGDLNPTRVERCEANFADGFADAEAAGGCNTTGDAAAVEATVDAFLASVDLAFFPPPTTTSTSTSTTTSTSSTTSTTLKFDLVWKGSYNPPVRGAEIVTVDPPSRRMFIAAGNRVDIVDVNDVTNPTSIDSISMAMYGSDTTSVSVRNGRVAAAVINSTKEKPGTIVFLDLDGDVLGSVEVGAVPDMVVHSPDGQTLAVANEGEPRCNGTTYVDPVGSISLIDLSSDPIEQSDVRTVSFAGLNGSENDLRAAGVRIFGLGVDAEHDLEPEYAAFSPDGATLYVGLQEANAYATVDVASASLTSVRSFGYKDHSLAANKLDPSDRDGAGTSPALKIDTWPVLGMYQPDGIGTFVAGGVTYLATANEGDSRGDYAACGGNEEIRGGDLAGRMLAGGLAGLDRDGDMSLALSDNDELNRLQITNQFPLPAAPNAISSLYVFGGRSMSIWNPSTGAQVFDSGSFMEDTVAAEVPAFHNSGVGKNAADGFDTRSDNKGPEPEGLVVGHALGRTLVFVGLERANGIMFWDVTDPTAPVFQEWERSQVVYDSDPMTAGAQPAGDLAPEGLAFVPAEQSWTDKPLLFVAHEADQPATANPTRTSIFELTTVP